MRTPIVVVLVCAAMALAGCGPIVRYGDSSQLIGSGKLVTQTYPLQGFTGIEASSNFLVTLRPGTDFAVSITADDNVIEHLSATVEGNELRIGMKPGEQWGLTNVTMRADVSLPVLKEVATSANATVHLGEVTADELRLDGNSNGLIDGRVTVGRLTAGAASNGQIKLSGSAGNLALTGGGNAVLRLEDLAAKTARVDLNSNAKANVQATEQLDYSVEGNANLTYSGGATLGEQKTSGNAWARGR